MCMQVPIESEPCDTECLVKNVISLVVSIPVLVLMVLLLVILLSFTCSKSLRVSRELKEARRELSIEYNDKKMMLRWANVEI